MKNIILTLTIVFLGNFLFSQEIISKDTIYIDENKKLSERDLVIKKCKSNVYYCKVIAYDTVVVFNVYYKYFFGKLKKEEYKQYISILKNRMTVKMDTNSTIVVNYNKTLNSYNSYINVLDSLNRLSHRKGDRRKNKPMSERIFNNFNKAYYKRQKKCLKKIGKIDNVNSIYLYSTKKGAKEDVGVFEWKRDSNQVFMKKFFGGRSKFNLLLLKPDGSFFLKSRMASSHDFSEKDVFNLLKYNDWSVFLKEWDIRIKKLSRSIRDVRIMMEYYTPRYNCFQ